MMFYTMEDDGNYYLASFMVRLFSPFLEAIFSLVLVISALYLAKSVREYTQKKQNTCLVNWHICNLLLLTSLLVLNAVIYHKALKTKDTKAIFDKYDYYSLITSIVSTCVDFYVDLFLLWLLYKFMKPQLILSDGKTEASVLLLSLAHETRSTDTKTGDNYHGRSANAFLTYMLKILIDGLRTESSIFDEFMDKSDRSSILNHLKVDGISEIICSDHLPTLISNTNESFDES